MHSILRIAAVSLAVSLGTAIAQDLHLIGPESSTQQPVSPSGMQQRVAAAAREYQKYGQVARVALFDIAYPKDLEEFEKTGGFGVLLLVSQSQISSELPPRRLYVRTGAEERTLHLLTSAHSKLPAGTLESSVLGPFRWEGLYIFPIRSQFAGSELVMDYQINRSGFMLTRFQSAGSNAAGLGPKRRLTVASSEKPNEAAIAELVRREFPGFVVKR